MSLRCLIVDDSSEFLLAARALLQGEGVDVVGVVVGAGEAEERVRALEPDVILVDVDLGADSGVDLACRLHGGGVAGELILISTQTQDDLAELVVGTPAIGGISKPLLSASAIEDLVDAAHA